MTSHVTRFPPTNTPQPARESLIAHWPLVIILCVSVWLGTGRAARAAPAGQQPATTLYTAQLDDTLADVAERYGTTPQAIAALNEVGNPATIAPGQRLTIPLAAPLTHTVRPGESLSGLAQRYGVTVEAIMQANDLANADLIYAGQELLIPIGDATAPATLPAPFAAISISPPSVPQGQAVAVQVRTTHPVTLTGSLGDLSLNFVEQSGQYWAIVGLSVWTEPGPQGLRLVAVDADGHTAQTAVLLTVTDAGFAVENIDLPPDRQNLLDPEKIRAEFAHLMSIVGRVTPERHWSGRFELPVQAPVTSDFGTKRSYNNGPVRSYHEGIDYDAAEGDPVLAANDGVVALAEPLVVRGNAIVIDHGWGVYSGYYHLSEIGVEVGQAVSQGEVIGKVGSTGLVTGPHLHWEIRVGGVPVNPRQWTQQMLP